jgi:site-specific DNA-methyltransferase (adenine-specific)
MVELNKIYNKNCIFGLKELDNDSIDLVVTSPPYDNMRQYDGSVDEWDWGVFLMTSKELYRVIKPGGVCVWVVGDQTKNGSETGTSFKQALEFVNRGFNLNDTMIWVKKNPMPQVKQPRYSQVFEYMFVFSKGKPKTFNPIMIPTKCGGQVYDSTCKNIDGESGRVHKTFSINKEKVHGNVFEIAVAQNRGKEKHPAVFPEELVDIHIETWSNEGDLVLDPFIGSGTTAISAIKHNRNYIGFDVNEKYCKIAMDNIAKLT